MYGKWKMCNVVKTNYKNVINHPWLGMDYTIPPIKMVMGLCHSLTHIRSCSRSKSVNVPQVCWAARPRLLLLPATWQGCGSMRVGMGAFVTTQHLLIHRSADSAKQPHLFQITITKYIQTNRWFQRWQQTFLKIWGSRPNCTLIWSFSSPTNSVPYRGCCPKMEFLAKDRQFRTGRGAHHSGFDEISSFLSPLFCNIRSLLVWLYATSLEQIPGLQKSWATPIPLV